MLLPMSLASRRFVKVISHKKNKTAIMAEEALKGNEPDTAGEGSASGRKRSGRMVKMEAKHEMLILGQIEWFWIHYMHLMPTHRTFGIN